MRLLNATTLRLETSIPGDEPPYAILSHRWTDDEVLFDDVQNGTAHTKGGFSKLRGCCDVALREGLTHVWIDTCCIDKSSSAELSEEINSMFRWYSRARVCYAYLHDATGVQDYLASEWFDRGWTLQELIAPGVVDFYAGDWTKFGSRSLLSSSLSTKTGIAEEYLHGTELRSASVAERMSWAAARKTARPEDMAYCLLGIFNIHMTPIYGEGGEKAFLRLQFELLNQLDDHSYLAWTIISHHQATVSATMTMTGSLGGLLARSPAAFKDCRDVVLCDREAMTTITPVSMTNVGIHVSLPVVKRGKQNLLLLRCRWRHDYWNVIAIPVAERFGRNYRTSMATTTCPEDDWPEREVPHDLLLSPDPYERDTALSYVLKPLPPGFRVTEVLPDDAWERHLDTHIQIKSEGTLGSSTRRLVRLERDTGVDESQDPHDYILKLDLKFRNYYGYHPECQLGILPRGCPLSQANEETALFGMAVSIPGQSAALAALLKMRPLHGRDTDSGSNEGPQAEVEVGTLFTMLVRLAPRLERLTLYHIGPPVPNTVSIIWDMEAPGLRRIGISRPPFILVQLAHTINFLWLMADMSLPLGDMANITRVTLHSLVGVGWLRRMSTACTNLQSFTCTAGGVSPAVEGLSSRVFVEALGRVWHKLITKGPKRKPKA
ncbi:uncharacterized protein DNG_09972 [Cephalotrichum gorgonifer]|uniref:Heterokaryon incompatibility domain-containing protein n=1 Tax=Cephalotrichum gorgonifer TaxID=2041049 RepID=A0AAE8N8C4_9PEZI|nr:uncharacterized protein DNG_09972 [Cephalotrichum gorgonifer]